MLDNSCSSYNDMSEHKFSDYFSDNWTREINLWLNLILIVIILVDFENE